jgi:hypothetical protein
MKRKPRHGEAVCDSGEPAVVSRVGPGMPAFLLQEPWHGIGCVGRWFETLDVFYTGDAGAAE